MFCVRWLVTASSSTDPVAASDSQRRYGGFVAALSSRSVSTAEGGVSPASAAQEAAKPGNNQDQRTTRSCAARDGSAADREPGPAAGGGEVGKGKKRPEKNPPE